MLLLVLALTLDAAPLPLPHGAARPRVLLPLAALPPGRLAIEIVSPQSSVLTGEPVKLAVIWKAFSGPVQRVAVEDELFHKRSLVFDVKGPNGKGTYTEFVKAIICDVWMPGDLPAGAEVFTHLVLTQGFYQRAFGRPIREFVFEEPGRYSLRAVYVWNGRRLAESNALRFEVSRPTGRESEVFEVVQEMPGILDARETAKLEALLGAHPRSRYLTWPRLQLLRERKGRGTSSWPGRPKVAIGAPSRRTRCRWH